MSKKDAKRPLDLSVLLAIAVVSVGLAVLLSLRSKAAPETAAVPHDASPEAF